MPPPDEPIAPQAAAVATLALSMPRPRSATADQGAVLGASPEGAENDAVDGPSGARGAMQTSSTAAQPAIDAEGEVFNTEGRKGRAHRDVFTRRSEGG